MSMSDLARQDLVNYRIQRAYETWSDTKSVMEDGLWYVAANRMYYACYYMTVALLIKNGISASTHAGVIRMLGMHFVTTGILSKEMGRFYSSLFEFRQRDDYEDFVVISADDVLPRVPLGYMYKLVNVRRSPLLLDFLKWTHNK